MMINRIKQKWFYALICFLVFLCACSAFLMVYKLGHFLFFSGMIGLVCLIILCIQKWWLRSALLLLSYFFTLYFYFPSNYSFGFTWLANFATRMQTVFFSLTTGNSTYLPAIVAMSFILLLMIILSLLIIHFEKWVLSFLIIVGYLCSLVLVNKLQLSWRILSISSLFLLMYIFQQYHLTVTPKSLRKLLLATTTIYLAIGLSAFYLPSLFPSSKLFL